MVQVFVASTRRGESGGDQQQPSTDGVHLRWRR